MPLTVLAPFTSIVGVGTAEIEIARFGGTTDEAAAALIKSAADAGLVATAKRDNRHKDRVRVTVEIKGVEGWSRKTTALLYSIARVNDLHGDAPMDFVLNGSGDVPEPGEWRKTGAWND